MKALLHMSMLVVVCSPISLAVAVATADDCEKRLDEREKGNQLDDLWRCTCCDAVVLDPSGFHGVEPHANTCPMSETPSEPAPVAPQPELVGPPRLPLPDARTPWTPPPGKPPRGPRAKPGRLTSGNGDVLTELGQILDAISQMSGPQASGVASGGGLHEWSDDPPAAIRPASQTGRARALQSELGELGELRGGGGRSGHGVEIVPSPLGEVQGGFRTNAADSGEARRPYSELRDEAFDWDVQRQVHEQKMELLPNLRNWWKSSDDPEGDYWHLAGVPDPRLPTVGDYGKHLEGLAEDIIESSNPSGLITIPVSPIVKKILPYYAAYELGAPFAYEAIIGPEGKVRYLESLDPAIAHLQAQIGGMTQQIEEFAPYASPQSGVPSADQYTFRQAISELEARREVLQERLDALEKSRAQIAPFVERYLKDDDGLPAAWPFGDSIGSGRLPPT